MRNTQGPKGRVSKREFKGVGNEAKSGYWFVYSKLGFLSRVVRATASITSVSA